MIHRTQFLLRITCLFFLLLSLSRVGADPEDPAPLREARTMRYQRPEIAIRLLDSLYQTYLNAADTALAVRALLHLSTAHGNQANYRGSYESLWKALLLTDAAQLDPLKVRVYQHIGRHYAYYKRREQTLHFLNQALALHRAQLDSGNMNRASLSHRYLAYCSSFIEFEEYDLAQVYLDSCFLVQDDSVTNSVKKTFLKAQQAFIFASTKRASEAIALLEPQLDWFEAKLPSYQVLVYSYLGDAYLEQGKVENGRQYYQKSLEVSDQFNSHVDFSILVREKLARLHFEQGQYRQAFQQLERVRELDSRYFDSRSEYNRPLLEIQDEYHRAVESKRQLLKEQRIAQLEHERKVTFLRNVLIFGLLIFTLVFATLLYVHLRNKHRIEQRLIKVEVQANREKLSQQEKELATSALKLVEKDQFLLDLKSRISEQDQPINARELNNMITQAVATDSQAWRAFESQFLKINDGFFQQLEKSFPGLTQGDKRLCALIKLNLSNKEIASILSVTVDSVYKSRYRLRKKMNLEKETDLTSFINGIT